MRKKLIRRNVKYIYIYKTRKGTRKKNFCKKGMRKKKLCKKGTRKKV